MLTDDHSWTLYDNGYQARCQGEARNSFIRVYNSADLAQWQAGWDAADKLYLKPSKPGSIILCMLGLMILGACSNASWRSYDLSRNPPGGVFEAKTECRLRAAPVSGYDWVDASSRRQAMFEYCMYQQGYRFGINQ